MSEKKLKTAKKSLKISWWIWWITFCALRPSFSWFTFCFLLLFCWTAAFSSTFSSSSEAARFFLPVTFASFVFLRPSGWFQIKKLISSSIESSFDLLFPTLSSVLSFAVIALSWISPSNLARSESSLRMCLSTSS